ncbi:LysR family transcriptional regulator [Paracoccus benzoatiresistens]|uniref:LysR family transcriptional regulator n=1 Tax=Paracoccus benzoatiresistens TaxID=2997341 RepID=A0ABT4J8H0_9RHOB|nr:LysR family transcriptional regulator [Paracoccus sp. EF6]MCZ0963377.1 LysR family transcriptional regulator [Paracoccus sp. EF6]
MAIISVVPPLNALLGRLRLRQLLLVVAIGELSSLRKAADRVGISQPAATKMLAELEAALGVPLFERGRRGMVATAYGTALIRHAHLVISDVGAMRDEIAGLASGTAGRLAIGMITAAAAGPLSIAVAQLKRRRPRLDVTITVETSDILIPMLEQGRLDVVIGRRVPSDQAADLEFTEIGPERLSVVTGAANPLRDRSDLTLPALGSEAWILQPRTSPLRQMVEAAFRDAGMETPANVIETASILTATTLLQHSDMVAVVPHSVALHYVSSGMMAILPVGLSRELDPYGVLTRKARARMPVLAELMALIPREPNHEVKI